MSKITHVEIRMYKMGTGDCFAMKLLAGTKTVFKIMVDAGTWQGDKEKLTPYINNLKDYFKGFVDVLVVTHEHKDHVHAFDVCRDIFTGDGFEVGEIWMGWTEKDTSQKVTNWKKDYGQKKRTLAEASEKLKGVMELPDYKKQFAGTKDGNKMLAARQTFTGALDNFTDLHLSFDEAEKLYKGGLVGMEIVKQKIKKKRTVYYKPGDVIQDLGEAEDVKIYVLGPPQLYEDIKKETGGEGETYAHNKQLGESEAFSAAILNMNNNGFVTSNLLPFDEHYLENITPKPVSLEAPPQPPSQEEQLLLAIKEIYNQEDWRKIDYDWLFSAGAFALRMNGLTNNLSLALAIEFGGENGKVVLLPGDAEYGSWASWHQINWAFNRSEKKDEKPKHFTEDLLNRTVFYKVAHHLSHNGTAQKLGLEMMKHEDLAAMATLDYSVIQNGWKSTMPNRAIVKELLTRTKGRLMIMNEKELFFDVNNEVPLSSKVEEAKGRMSSKERNDFEECFDASNPLFLQYTIRL